MLRWLLCVALWLAPGAASPAKPQEALSLADALPATPLGPSAADAIGFVALLERMGQPEDAEALRRELRQTYLQNLAGAEPDPQRTLGDAIERGRKRQAVEPDAAALWRSGYSKALAVEWPDPEARRIPEALGWLAGSIEATDPGVWTTRPGVSPQKIFVSVKLRNTGHEPVPVFEPLLVLAGDATGKPLVCGLDPPMKRSDYEGVRSVRPGWARTVLCEAPADAQRQQVVATLVDLARRGGTPPTLHPGDQDDAILAQRLDNWIQTWGDGLHKAGDRLRIWNRLWEESPNRKERRWLASDRPLEPPRPEPKSPGLGKRVGERLGPVLTALAVSALALGLFALGRRLERSGWSAGMARMATGMLLLGGAVLTFFAIASDNPRSGTGLSQPWIGAAFSMIFFVYALFGMLMLHALHRLLDRDEIAWGQAIWSGWNHMFHWQGTASRGEFWGFIAHFVWLWAIARAGFRPWDLLLFLLALPALGSLAWRRVRGMTGDEFTVLVLIVLSVAIMLIGT